MADREGVAGIAPDEFAEAHVGKDRCELHRAEQLIERLQERLVHAERETGPEIEQRGEAEKRKQRARGANAKCRCEFIR